MIFAEIGDQGAAANPLDPVQQPAVLAPGMMRFRFEIVAGKPLFDNRAKSVGAEGEISGASFRLYALPPQLVIAR